MKLKLKWPFPKNAPEIKPPFENKGIAQAQKMGWITEEEFLGLSMDRAEKKYKAFLEEEKIKAKAKLKTKNK